MCAPLLSTCTLNRKSRHNKSGTSAFGGMWKISFQNFHTGVFPCYVWTPMHMLALGAWPGMESCSINCNWAFLPRTSKLQWGDATFPAGKSVYGSCNTFFDVGATYYGPPPRRHVTRIDYICVPESCLQKVSRCHVQYMAADSLQLICDCARRDHVPLQIEIDLQLEFAGVAANTRKTWDAEPLVLDALVGKRREALFNAVDRQLETHVGTSTILADKPCNPDILWTKVATALQAATEEIYPPKQRKHSDRPLDTQDAIETMLQKRAQLVSFRPKMLGNGRFRFDCGSPFTSNRLCKIFCWYGARDVNIDRHGRRWMTAQKGTQKPDKSRNSTNFSLRGAREICTKPGRQPDNFLGNPLGQKDEDTTLPSLPGQKKLNGLPFYSRVGQQVGARQLSSMWTALRWWKMRLLCRSWIAQQHASLQNLICGHCVGVPGEAPFGRLVHRCSSRSLEATLVATVADGYGSKWCWLSKANSATSIVLPHISSPAYVHTTLQQNPSHVAAKLHNSFGQT